MKLSLLSWSGLSVILAKLWSRLAALWWRKPSVSKREPFTQVTDTVFSPCAEFVLGGPHEPPRTLP